MKSLNSIATFVLNWKMDCHSLPICFRWFFERLKIFFDTCRLLFLQIVAVVAVGVAVGGGGGDGGDGLDGWRVLVQQ